MNGEKKNVEGYFIAKIDLTFGMAPRNTIVRAELPKDAEFYRQQSGFIYFGKRHEGDGIIKGVRETPDEWKGAGKIEIVGSTNNGHNYLDCDINAYTGDKPCNGIAFPANMSRKRFMAEILAGRKPQI